MRQTDFQEERQNTSKDLSEIAQNRIPLIFILDNLTDVGNMGMIFRIADALRIEKIFFYGDATQIHARNLAKKARSTTKYVSHEFATLESIKNLSPEYKLVALDKTTHSTPYSNYTDSKPVALIVGSERFGISQELLDLATEAIHLPMNGVNISINVATATAVAAFHIAQYLYSSE